MPKTRPTADQLRFNSSANGESILDDYIEAAEKGGRSIPDLLDEFFDGSGLLKNFVDFREDPLTAGDLQFRLGVFLDPEAGWQTFTSSDFSAFVTACANSETAAATSESNAATSESNAATSESNAATSESNAAASETAAINAQSYSEEWANANEDILVSAAAGGNQIDEYSAKHWAAKASQLADEVDDRYLGAKSANPAVDNDGDPLQDGAFYWNNVSKNLVFYDLGGGTWNVATVGVPEAPQDGLQYYRVDASWTSAFKSIGIDDNATGERVGISDTTLTLGSNSAADIYRIYKQLTDGVLIVGGGDSGSSGARIDLYGSTHATLPNVLNLRAGGNIFFQWDESAGSLALLTGTGVKTQTLFLNSSQNAIFSGDVLAVNITATRGDDSGALYLGDNADSYIFKTPSNLNITLDGANAADISPTSATFAGNVVGATASFDDILFNATEQTTTLLNRWVGTGTAILAFDFDKASVDDSLIRFGRNTNTTGDLISQWFLGDGTATTSMAFNHKTGVLNIGPGGTDAGINISSSNTPLVRLTDTTNSVVGNFYADDTQVAIESDSNHPFSIRTNSTVAATFGIDQSATHFGDVTVSKALPILNLTSTNTTDDQRLRFNSSNGLESQVFVDTSRNELRIIKLAADNVWTAGEITLEEGGDIRLSSGGVSGGPSGVTNLTLSGGTGSELATFAGNTSMQYISGYAGTPTDGEVLTWVNANGRAEFQPIDQEAFKVGGIYTNTTGVNPATELGYGTWSQTGQGRVLLGEGTGGGATYTGGATGGSKDSEVVTHTHSITHDHAAANTANVADHAHSTPTSNGGANIAGGKVKGGSGGFTGSSEGTNGGGGHAHSFNMPSFSGNSGNPSNTNNNGVGQNLPPYLVVYFWERTL